MPYIGLYTGASIPPKAMMYFPPVSDFPPIFERISDDVENFLNFTFFRNISRFSSAKVSDDLLFKVIDHTFWISLLYFCCFSTFFYFLLLWKMSSLFSKNPPAFYILYVYFVSLLLWPWSPNARTGRPCLYIEGWSLFFKVTQASLFYNVPPKSYE